MAYLALYRKWRPRTFSEVVGQKHISIPLRRAIRSARYGKDQYGKNSRKSREL